MISFCYESNQNFFHKNTKHFDTNTNSIDFIDDSEGGNLDISVSMSSLSEEAYVNSEGTFDPKYNDTLIAYDEESANKLWKGRQAENLRK